MALPEDDVWEKLGGWLGITRAEHLHSGDMLLASLLGRCDVVLHGHRHRPHRYRMQSEYGTLHISSGGSSTELFGYRTLAFAERELVASDWFRRKCRPLTTIHCRLLPAARRKKSARERQLAADRRHLTAPKYCYSK